MLMWLCHGPPHMHTGRTLHLVKWHEQLLTRYGSRGVENQAATFVNQNSFFRIHDLVYRVHLLVSEPVKKSKRQLSGKR